MPDIGGFRRQLADQAKQVAQQASQAGRQHIEQFSAHRPSPAGAGAHEAEDGASEADVYEEVNRLRAFLANRRPPPGPVRGRWSSSRRTSWAMWSASSSAIRLASSPS